MAHSQGDAKGRRDARRNRALALLARGLTIARVAAIPPFVWLLHSAARDGAVTTRASLVLVYAFVALSDFIDGRLARRAGAVTPSWGRADVAADVTFNFASLAAAAWIGLVGPWVAAGVAVLGGRFLWTMRSDDVVEDARGKLAGVLYYVLVGWVVVEVAMGGVTGRTLLARGGDAVFVYTAAVLLGRLMSSRRR